MKSIWWLNHSAGCRAVVIESTNRDAQQRATLMDPYQRDWSEANVSRIHEVRSSRTSQVLAMDGLK